MRWSLAGACAVLMMAGAYAPAAPARPVPALKPAWQVPITGEVEHLAVAADATCVGAIERTRSETGRLTDARRLLMLASSGELRSQLRLPAGLVRTTTLAVAPGCQWAAVGQLPTDSYDRSLTRELLVVRADGTGAGVPVRGVVRSAAISHRGDLLVVGVQAAQGAPNLLVVAPSGKVVFALEAATYDEPIVRFSDDGGVVIVSAWFGVGVVRRSGAIAWGLTRDSSGERWRRVDASRDAAWFAAHVAPMHGPPGGSAALLRADGSTVWETPSIWNPEAVIAPDGSFIVIAGAPGSGPEPAAVPAVRVLSVRNRDGRTLAEREARFVSLEFVSGDTESIVVLDRPVTARDHQGGFR